MQANNIFELTLHENNNFYIIIIIYNNNNIPIKGPLIEL